MKYRGSKIVAIIEMASCMTKKFVWVEVDTCQYWYLQIEAIILTVCNMFTFWSNAWKNVYRNYCGLLLPYFHKALPFTRCRREHLHTLQRFSKPYKSR